VRTRGEITDEESATNRRDFKFLLIFFFVKTCLFTPVVLSFSISIPSKTVTSTAIIVPVAKIVLQYGEYQQDGFRWPPPNFLELSLNVS